MKKTKTTKFSPYGKKPNKFLAWVNKKGKWVILSTGIFLAIGITALIVGFGLAYGWLAVLQWFGSRWAIYIYILLGLLVFLVIWVIHKAKMEEK